MTDDVPTIGRACMLLAVLVDEVRGLRADMAGRKPSSSKPRELSAADVRMLTALLPAIVAAIRGETFTVGRLREVAQGRTRAANTLRAALADTALDPLKLGHLLKRAAKSEIPIEGLFAHRIGPTRDGVTFRVDAKTRDHHIAAGVAVALREKFQP